MNNDAQTVKAGGAERTGGPGPPQKAQAGLSVNNRE